MELESIGRNIRKFRLMRNLRQEDLAEMAGLSINYVGALERGEKIPSLETFIVLQHSFTTVTRCAVSSTSGRYCRLNGTKWTQSGLSNSLATCNCRASFLTTSLEA